MNATICAASDASNVQGLLPLPALLPVVLVYSITVCHLLVVCEYLLLECSFNRRYREDVDVEVGFNIVQIIGCKSWIPD